MTGARREEGEGQQQSSGCGGQHEDVAAARHALECRVVKVPQAILRGDGNEICREDRDGPDGRPETTASLLRPVWGIGAQRTSGTTWDSRCAAPTRTSCSVRPNRGMLWLVGPKS